LTPFVQQEGLLVPLKIMPHGQLQNGPLIEGAIKYR
jgi:hypothetical protein